MTTFGVLARPAEILLWLGVVALVVFGVAALAFVAWLIPHLRREWREADRRHVDFRRELDETRERIRQGSRRRGSSYDG